jgi:hypothetical protein
MKSDFKYMKSDFKYIHSEKEGYRDGFKDGHADGRLGVDKEMGYKARLNGQSGSADKTSRYQDTYASGYHDGHSDGEKSRDSNGKKDGLQDSAPYEKQGKSDEHQMHGHNVSNHQVSKTHMSKAHPGFAKVASQIAKKEGYSTERAARILAASTRGASAAAHKKNPHLGKVKG